MESRLHKQKHINYWKRCLKTYLPHQYTSNDPNRMTLAFFIVSALDLLDCLKSETTPDERENYARWIYHCQHPEGGFRGFPATDLGPLRNDRNKVWDPANLPATFFALASLVILEDDLERAKRRQCLEWLRRMQRPDGSFGETIGEDGKIEGGQDTRFGYCATGVRWILRGTEEGGVEGVPDIEVDKLVQCIRISETYDGGISEAPFHEAHAGFTYCAISALSFLNRLPPGARGHGQTATEDDGRLTGLTSLDLTIHWLVSRQTATLDEDDEFDTNGDETDTTATCHDAHSFVAMTDFKSKGGKQSYDERPTSHFELQWTGFNGRCNKIADTCYAFWALGSLGILNKYHLTDYAASRRYLLDKTQHLVGGFGKLPGDPPDLYHSYLGLAALGVIGEASLKPVVPELCISKDACRHLEALPWRRSITGGRAAVGDTDATDTAWLSVSAARSEGCKEEEPPQRDTAERAELGHGGYIAMSGG